ncbi:MAG TPA: XRE family transcriptional regulator [Caulobacter sp.]|nr:XRE family transcriptional regulator [Caulobacter sp.]
MSPPTDPLAAPHAAAAERLRRARRAKGLASAAEAARLHGWNLNTYASNENGNASFSFRKAEDYARAFGVRAEWLYAGKGAMKAKRAGLPVLGKVAAGAEALFDDDYEMGAAADWLDPMVPEDGIVLIVDGESMMPRFRHGEHLIFGRRYDDPSPLVGQEVMARLADGRKMVKILRRGAAPGLWTLESINTRYPPIEDVELLWALPFQGLRV